MKFTMMTTVFAVAVMLAGCRYDKADRGAGADGVGDGMASDISTTDVTTLPGAAGDTGLVTDAGVAGRNFEDIYQRCTDVAFSPVYFQFDSTVVPQGELGKVDAVAQHLNSMPNRVVVVEGHCDERGSNEYNLSLGESRATIVRNYLVQSGVAADRIQTRSYGEEKPADPGHDNAAWDANRRGEFAIFQK